MTPAFTYPPKPNRGDAVAVLSPSGRSAARFAVPYELGLKRLREEFGLVPVEYPTTRAAEASPAERAKDIHAAFTDPDIRAVITTSGGEDELKVLAHLDAAALTANPKPFFGYSDNTNLELFLWNLGLVSYHGGAVLTQFGRPGVMHPATRASLEYALFSGGTFELKQPAEYSDEEGDWGDPATFEHVPVLSAAPAWSWHGPAITVSGPAWGGSLEIIDFHLRANRYLLADSDYDEAVLYLETSEETPEPSFAYRVLMCLGERGLLQRFSAILWGRPKAWSFEHPRSPQQKEQYVRAQRDAVLAALAEYHREAPLVFGVDFGHTDPQLVIPCGGKITVDRAAERIVVTY